MFKSIYIAATKQNDGKTITSLGLLYALQKRFSKIGFIKPVGQLSVLINNERIDKDSFLIKSVCNIDDPIKKMSPIAIPHGFTENYIQNREQEHKRLKKKLLDSFSSICQNKEFIVIEGTGHAGVGSIIDFNNAKVAKLFGSKVIIVSKGGLGKPIDEIVMNKTLFEKEGVEILGVIMNQVIEEKFEKIKHLAKVSLDHIGLKLLGVIPQEEVLSAPTMYIIQQSLKGEIVNGDYFHENFERIIVGAMTANKTIEHLTKGTLLITPGDRDDLLFASLSSTISNGKKDNGISGIILTEGELPNKTILDIVAQTNIPVIAVQQDTYQTASIVYDLLVKIGPQDTTKINIAKELVSKYVDIDYIIQNT